MVSRLKFCFGPLSTHFTNGVFLLDQLQVCKSINCPGKSSQLPPRSFQKLSGKRSRRPMSQSGLEIQDPSLRLPPNLLTWVAATHWAPGRPHTSKLCHLSRSPTWDQLPFFFLTSLLEYNCFTMVC